MANFSGFQVKPLVKWAGGKRQLLPLITELLPTDFDHYYEPFLGGGALLCALNPKAAVVNDVNQQLIGMYEQVKIDPDGVCSALSDLQEQYNSKATMIEKDELYYTLRGQFNDYLQNGKTMDCVYAALLIFLNKAGFNGLYRVNNLGLYNVPPAHRQIVNAYDRDNIFAMSELLKHTQLLCGDFEKACADADKKDFVFFDSPYYDTFDTYQAGGFSEADHIRLFNLFRTLAQKGAYCMMTNNDCAFIKELYRDFHIRVVDVKRMINCDGKKRTGREVIVTSYCLKGDA